MGFRDFLNESTRDYVNKRLKDTLRKEGMGFKVDKKTGFDKYLLDNDVSIINDGVGVSVKVNNKEVYYGDTPKLDYKKAIDTAYDAVYE